MFYRLKNRNGFTLEETLITITITALTLLLILSVYILYQRTYRKGSNKAEISQNARITIDKIGRDIRQSLDIVTKLPANPDETDNPPTNYIMFQDGHDNSKISYIKYYLDGNNLKSQKIIYYFDEDPDTYVYYDSVDESGDPPKELILEDNLVAEYVQDIKFWGDKLINIEINMKKGEEKLSVRTKIFGRNL